MVAYANEAKADLLGVDPALIDAHGAVSEPVAEAMADGALRRFGADTAVAITGIAGPGGGTEDKPVGTVCFTVALADGETSPGPFGCPATGPTSGSARRPWRCTCCVKRSAAPCTEVLLAAVMSPVAGWQRHSFYHSEGFDVGPTLSPIVQR